MIRSLIPARSPVFSVAQVGATLLLLCSFSELFFFEVVATEGIPLLMEIIGERCILMNARPSAERGAAGSERASSHAAYCTYERTPGPRSSETANESLKNPHGTSRFLKP